MRRRTAITRLGRILGILTLLLASAMAQANPEGPTSEKARKTFDEASRYLEQHMIGSALDDFKKANQQDGGHCVLCEKKMLKYGIQLGDWKIAESAASELVSAAHDAKSIAIAHYDFGMLLMYEGLGKNKDQFFARAHDELTKALTAVANFPDATFADGQALAHLKQDDAAKAQFQKFVAMRPADDPDCQRAQRYISRPELARARMAPPFAVTATDGRRISLDDLKGRVVLLDFWATWCGPCREALPHLRDIARKFQGQPLVILSISLDTDPEKWRDFVAKNGMTWAQYYDGGFDGPIAKLFGVDAIPHTFTIDADGVLQDEKIGDASIEGKLKKLVAHAGELQAPQTGAELKP